MPSFVELLCKAATPGPTGFLGSAEGGEVTEKALRPAYRPLEVRGAVRGVRSHARRKEVTMPFLTPSAQQEMLSELEFLAQLLNVEVIESIKFPSVMVRVSSGGTCSTITKEGADFLATEMLPDVPMTFIGRGMFNYRLDL
jgi:hypothetical protein